MLKEITHYVAFRGANGELRGAAGHDGTVRHVFTHHDGTSRNPNIFFPHHPRAPHGRPTGHHDAHRDIATQLWVMFAAIDLKGTARIAEEVIGKAPSAEQRARIAMRLIKWRVTRIEAFTAGLAKRSRELFDDVRLDCIGVDPVAEKNVVYRSTYQ
ncbi:hypothetical protein LZC95_14085 [Pendulispora brunnea]|uniref:Uncharacterized protein n=1 Tax=Pendulispora brunnea TaxID=2905690 RepID=A0ABZ2KKW6_9BACT